MIDSPLAACEFAASWLTASPEYRVSRVRAHKHIANAAESQMWIANSLAGGGFSPRPALETRRALIGALLFDEISAI